MVISYKKVQKTYRSFKLFKKNKKFVYCRYFFDDLEFDKRSEFVVELIKSECFINSILEIQYWENDQKIETLFNSYRNENSLIRSYKSTQRAGVFVVEKKKLDFMVFQELIKQQFNFELALEPALNIKVMLFLETSGCLKVFDFYDDRGFLISQYFNMENESS